MIIEFFGLPGSGKTFYTQKISQQENIKIIEINSRIERYLFSSLFAVLHPVIFLRIFFLIMKETYSNPGLFFHKTNLLFLNALAVEQKASFKKGDVIIDEGLFQFLLSIFEKQFNVAEIEFVLNFFKQRPYYVYIIDSDELSRKERMEKRGRIPRQVFGKEYVNNWLNIISKNYVLISDLIKSNFEYKLIKNWSL